MPDCDIQWCEECTAPDLHGCGDEQDMTTEGDRIYLYDRGKGCSRIVASRATGEVLIAITAERQR